MHTIRLVAVALATLLVTAGGVAATPVVPAEHRTTTPGAAANATDRGATDPGASARTDPAEAKGAAEPVATGTRTGAAAGPERGDAADRAEARGPPSDLPAAIPDHVAAIHDTIRSFLSGALDGSLGESMSSVAGDEDSTGVPAGG